MRLEQLRCLTEVAKNRSISKVAQQLYMTQQAVSLSIRQLEKELDCTLLIRNSKGVTLTEAGKATVAFAEQVLEEKENLKSVLDQLEERESDEEERHIHICSISTVINHVLPKIIAHVHKKNVTVKLDMVDDLETVIQKIKNQESDIGLITFNEQELLRIMENFQGEIVLDVLARDKMIAVFNRKHYDGETDSIPMEECFNTTQVRTLYNITPVENMRQGAQAMAAICSSDADFHRNMLKYADAMVLMAGFSYQYFFSSKNFVALPVEGLDVPMVHAAIYHKNAENWTEELIRMIRQEMRVK